MIPLSIHRQNPAVGSILMFAVVSGLTTATLVVVFTLMGSL